MGHITAALRSMMDFFRGVFSDNGLPSSSRILMYIFAFFAMHILWRVFSHILTLTDTTQLTIWLSNLPLMITAFIGLITLPYTINKGADAITGVASIITASKQVQLNTAVESKVADMVKRVQSSAPPVQDVTIVIPPVVGSSGPKG